MMKPADKCLRRARRYRRIATRNFARLFSPYWLWIARSKAAARGLGPQQLRGKSAWQLLDLIYPR